MLKRLNTLNPNSKESTHHFYNKYIIICDTVFTGGTRIIPEEDPHKKIETCTPIDVISCYSFVHLLLQIFEKMNDFVTHNINPIEFMKPNPEPPELYSVIDQLSLNHQHSLRCDAP
jgi:hypothetical protein